MGWGRNARPWTFPPLSGPVASPMDNKPLIQRGSSIQRPKGPQCKRCFKPIRREIIENQEAPEGFCSISCGENQEDELSDKKLRELVLERDKGICSICKEDCLALRAHLDEFRKVVSQAQWEARLRGLERVGFDRHAIESGAPLFEVDHYPPRVRGGRNTLEGARSLCLGCHKKATAGLAKERAAARRPVANRRRFGR